ncbi:hypothetical protein GMRT_12791 [Giardia muris]|uniref:Uncharacterized protein n=1 Tax=Giardia muris TaxID=5742 RepID=A0A4Z1T3L7_GIAMU|nr:hypothetical protein GMRT_12791 [Giardia muris]|eukprot:TNJ27129.1 hypothetical protein GMRT_12791 [Giardia muris]
MTTVPTYKDKLCETVLRYRALDFKLVFYNDRCTKFDLYDGCGRVAYTYSFTDTKFTGIYAFPGPQGTYFVTKNAYLFLLKYPACRGFKPILLDNTIIRIRNPEKTLEAIFHYGASSFSYVRKVYNSKTKMVHHVCFHCNHNTLVRSIAKSAPEKDDSVGQLDEVITNEHLFCLTSTVKGKKRVHNVQFKIDPAKPYHQYYDAEITDITDDLKLQAARKIMVLESRADMLVLDVDAAACVRLAHEGRVTCRDEDEVEITPVSLPSEVASKLSDVDADTIFANGNRLYIQDQSGAHYTVDLASLAVAEIDAKDFKAAKKLEDLCTSIYTNDYADGLHKHQVHPRVGDPVPGSNTRSTRGSVSAPSVPAVPPSCPPQAQPQPKSQSPPCDCDATAAAVLAGMVAEPVSQLSSKCCSQAAASAPEKKAEACHAKKECVAKTEITPSRAGTVEGDESAILAGLVADYEI